MTPNNAGSIRQTIPNSARLLFLACLLTSAMLLSCGNPADTDVSSVPPVPLSVRAAGSSLNGIRVTWVRVLDATSYNVFRGSSSDTDSSVFVKNVAVDTFFDTGLVAGAVYYYEVSSENRLGKSAKSVAAGSTTAFPVNVIAKGDSTSGILVTWNPIPGAVLYNAYRSLSDTGVFTAVGSATNDTFVDTGLNPGSVYYYKIRAAGGSLESPFSAVVHAITIAVAPIGLTVDSVLAKFATIVWLPDTGASSYKVYRSTSDTGTFAAVGTCASDTFVDTGLSPGTRYYYAVTAVNLSGESQKSTHATTLTVPAAPKILVDSALSGSTELVIWNAVMGATAYRVYRSDSVPVTFMPTGATVSDTFFVDTGLSSSIKHFYEVTAIDSSGESAPSPADTADTLQVGLLPDTAASEKLAFIVRSLPREFPSAMTRKQA
jgi:fibronectin type 3 domain-containing protein